mgnify:CR=1 FL=1
MRKIILLFILTFNLIIFTNVLKNVKAKESINEIQKPLILLKGYNYDEYLDYENCTIIQNNLNINKIGEYKIVYQNDLTGDEYTKRIYVKSEEDLVSDKCYSDDYLPLYGSTSRMIVHKYLYHNGFYYFAISEEVNDDLFNMYLVKLENDKLYYKKNVMLSDMSPSSSTYLFVNDLKGETFVANEKQLTNQSAISNMIEFSYDSEEMQGYVYVNGGKLYYRSNDSTVVKKLSTSASSVVKVVGKYVYYVSSSALYRVDATKENPSGEKLSDSNTINTSYIAIDSNFAYFYVKNSSTSKYETYYIDLINCVSGKTKPVKVIQ